VSGLAEEERRLPRLGKEADPLSFIFAGAFLTVLGGILLLDKLHYIPAHLTPPLLALSAGLILLLDAAVRYPNPRYRRKALAYLPAGVLCLAVGFALLLGFERGWPILPLTAGLMLLAYGVLRILG